MAHSSFARTHLTPELNLFSDARYHQIMDTFADKADITKTGYYYNMVEEFKVDVAEVLNLLYIYSEIKSGKSLPQSVIEKYGVATESEAIVKLSRVLNHLKYSAGTGVLYQMGDENISLKMILVLANTITEHVEDFHIKNKAIKELLVSSLLETVDTIIHHPLDREKSRMRVTYLTVTENSIADMEKALTPPTFLQKMKSKIMAPIASVKGLVPHRNETAPYCFRLFGQSR